MGSAALAATSNGRPQIINCDSICIEINVQHIFTLHLLTAQRYQNYLELFTVAAICKCILQNVANVYEYPSPSSMKEKQIDNNKYIV